MNAARSDGDGRPFDLVAVGDPVLDVVVQSAALPCWDDKHLGRSMRQWAGGTEANAACAASRLGLRVGLFGAVGDDPVADFLCRELRAYGVDDRWLLRRSGASTAAAIVYVSDQGERAVTYVPAPGGREREDELAQMLVLTRCVYTMPYDPSRLHALASAAHAAGALLAVDVERAVAAVHEAWRVLAACADVMFFNEAGFVQAAGCAPTPPAAAALLEATQAQLLVVTLGRRGALAVDRHGQVAVQAAYEARPVDTTGAGDTFNGAFLAAWLRGAALAPALAQACAAACLCVEVQGARAPSLDAESVAEVQRRRLIEWPRAAGGEEAAA